MSVRKLMAAATVALAAVLALAITTGGFAASGQEVRHDARPLSSPTSVASATRASTTSARRVVKTAGKQLGITPRIFISKSSADYIPNLSTAARQGYNPSSSCGFLMGGDIEKAAKKFPNTSFGIIDYSQSWMKSDPQNLRGALFSENESGYLMGVAAAMATKTNSVSAVGGQAVPAVVAYLAGFKAGAKATKKGIKVTTAYSEDFVDQAKCKEIALNQIAAGLGRRVPGGRQLRSRRARGRQGARASGAIGVDTDQGFLGPHILTSALKLVDLGVFRMIRDVKEGNVRGRRGLALHRQERWRRVRQGRASRRRIARRSSPS